MDKRTVSRIWNYLSSLQLAIICLALLMVLVVACTLAQVDLGTYGAVNKFMRSVLVWWQPGGGSFRLPVFPGGALVGLVLTINLILATFQRLELRWGKAGLWIVHFGLILLVAGEFVSGAFQVDMRMAIEQGQTVNYLESPRHVELALIDTTDPKSDDVYAIPEKRLRSGGNVALPGSPVSLNIKAFYRNSDLKPMQGGASLATTGIGLNVAATEKPETTSDEEGNLASAYVEPLAGGKSLGVFLASEGLGAPQSFTTGGHTYTFEMRAAREYLPYSLTLRKFSHDVYAGTDIPKNFSSLVHLSNTALGETRDVLIYMNQPLRYDGKAFYQASFGKGDMLSILQVVENPGWLLPYISCALVALGLVTHFLVMLFKFLGRRAKEA
ncbi:MAG TPA: cytochrome c biogenesis protein ResB [Holophagaceae bacterium]|nr:cytochrome c biogenesis protein ResB [Holophagaceae bacterium]